MRHRTATDMRFLYVIVVRVKTFYVPNRYFQKMMFVIIIVITCVFLTSFTCVTNDTNEGSVPFWSKQSQVNMMLLSMLTQWKLKVVP